jgi:hypothetical protein
MLATILSPVIASYTLGGSIFSFAFPMLLVIIVSLTLYAVFSKTSEVPGHRSSTAATVAHTSGPDPTSVAVTDIETLPEGGSAPSPGEDA